MTTSGSISVYFNCYGLGTENSHNTRPVLLATHPQ